MKKLLYKNMGLLGILLLLVFASPVFAALPNADYFSHTGAMTPSGGTIMEAVAAPDDGKFIQMDAGSTITLKFPGTALAMPDGTAAPDLRIDIFDALFLANAEILVSFDGIVWTSMGIYPDTANIDLNLEIAGPVKYVKIDQNGHDIHSDYPTLGFDLDAVVALNLGDESDIEPSPTVPTNKNECKKGGWMTLVDSNGRGFKNQGDCVSFVSTGGKNLGAGN